MSSGHLSRINANLLVALDLLLQERSVARAAAEAGVTPSAMSHSLRALRRLFDDPLLIRTGGGMTPSPLAEELAGPLRRALRDLALAVQPRREFDPARAEQHFVVVAPDFLSTLLLVPVAKRLEREAPGIEIEIRPIDRAPGLRLRHTSMLAEGQIDLAIGALLEGMPGIRQSALYDERFVCVARKGHPAIRGELDLDTYVSIPHLLISITDDRAPTWIDRALAEGGRQRRVQIRTRYFMAAPMVVAESDLLLTCPYQLARYFAARFPLQILDPPLSLPVYAEYQAWHERFDADPASRWLRSVLARAALEATAEG